MLDSPSPWEEVTYESLQHRLSRLRPQGAGKGFVVPRQRLRVRLQMLDDRRASLSIKCDTKPLGVPSLQLVECAVSQEGNGWWLHVAERQPSQERLVPFYVDLCRKLESAGSSDQAVSTVKSVLKEWSKAFAMDRGDLTRDQMLGLAGELEVLARLLGNARVHTAEHVLGWWQGPDSADHDFDLPGLFQIEVKASGPATEKLHISNEHQLESKDKLLYLARVGVEMVPKPSSATRTLPDMVAEISERLAGDGVKGLFADLVIRAGLNVLDQRYEDQHFRVYSVEYYEIDQRAPRIVPNDLRPGVSHVTYRINLADLKSLQMQEAELMKGL